MKTVSNLLVVVIWLLMLFFVVKPLGSEWAVALWVFILFPTMNIIGCAVEDRDE